MKNTTTRQVIFWLAFAIPVCVHAILLYRYSINAPRLDDFSDGFVFLVHFNTAESLAEKIQWLFSLYQNHRWGMLHSIYAWYGCMDFRSASFLSMPWLLALLGLFHHETRNKPYHLPALLAASFLVFNLHTWTGMFWITASLAAFPSIALALAAFTVITKNHHSWHTLLLTAAIALVATFTNGNGTFIWLLVAGWLFACAFLEKKPNALQLLFWLAASTTVLAIFFTDLVFTQGPVQDERVSGAAQKIMENPLLFTRAVFATIGSNMIYYSGSEDWRVTLAIAIGVAECVLFGWLLLNGALRDKPALILLALYIGATMAAIAASRVMVLGMHQAFQGHYKLYNSTFLLLLLTALMDWVYTNRASRTNIVPALVIALTAIMYVTSLVLFIPKTDRYHKELEADTRNWLYNHTLRHAETRLYVPEFNKKLTAAVNAKAYDPWQLIKRHEKPFTTETATCPASIAALPASTDSHKLANAVLLTMNVDKKIAALYLCSPLQVLRVTVQEQQYSSNENGTYSLQLWVPRDKNIQEDAGPWQVYPAE